MLPLVKDRSDLLYHDTWLILGYAWYPGHYHDLNDYDCS